MCHGFLKADSRLMYEACLLTGHWGFSRCHCTIFHSSAFWVFSHSLSSLFYHSLQFTAVGLFVKSVLI